MSERTQGPWVIYADRDIMHIKIKGVHPPHGGAHVAEVLGPANAAAIVLWENNFDALVTALQTITLIAEGSTTANSLPHIAKISRDALAKVKP